MRATTATLAVAALLLAGIGVNVVDFPRIEGMLGSWSAIPREEPGNLERPSFAKSRFDLYFALRAHTDEPVIVVPERLDGTVPGRYYGIGDASLIVVHEFDVDELLSELDIEDYVVASGDYADGRGSYQLALLDEQAETLVLLHESEFEPRLVDLRLLPESAQQELAP